MVFSDVKSDEDSCVSSQGEGYVRHENFPFIKLRSRHYRVPGRKCCQIMWYKVAHSQKIFLQYRR